MTTGAPETADAAASGGRDWAVVTGASSGIGAAFAEALGRRGFAVALVARSRERLEAVADRIDAPTRILPGDLSGPGLPGEVATFVAAPETPVALLVNCAGTGVYGPLVGQTERQVLDMVGLNLGGLLTLTRATLPGMVERGHGGIVNVSSSVSDTAAPGAAVYAATKAAVDSFSRSLRWEVSGRGIVVTCVRPGYTRTPFLDDCGGVPDSTEPLWQQPEVVVEAALRAHEAGRPLVSVPRPRVRDRLRRQVGPLRRRVPAPVMAIIDRVGIT